MLEEMGRGVKPISQAALGKRLTTRQRFAFSITKAQLCATPQQGNDYRVEQKRKWYNTLHRWIRHKGYLSEGAPMEPTLKKLRVVLTITTMTDTSTLHGEFTDLREAVAYLRKLADEIETEVRSERTETHHPSLH